MARCLPLTRKLRSITNKLSAAILLCLLLILWQAVSDLGLVPKFMFPSPVDVGAAFVEDFPILMANSGTTLAEGFLGLGLGIALAFVTAVLMDRYRFLYKSLYPILVITQTIPTVAIAPLLVLSLKVATCSLASVTVFSGLDPDKLSNGLMWYGCPERLSFSISYAYRMLPMLMEEFQNILLSFRLRGNPPSREGLWGKVKYLFYQVKVVMHAFYPLMLNTAKRSRTTVEALAFHVCKRNDN